MSIYFWEGSVLSNEKPIKIVFATCNWQQPTTSRYYIPRSQYKTFNYQQMSWVSVRLCFFITQTVSLAMIYCMYICRYALDSQPVERFVQFVEMKVMVLQSSKTQHLQFLEKHHMIMHQTRVANTRERAKFAGDIEVPWVNTVLPSSASGVYATQHCCRNVFAEKQSHLNPNHFENACDSIGRFLVSRCMVMANVPIWHNCIGFRWQYVIGQLEQHNWSSAS